MDSAPHAALTPRIFIADGDAHIRALYRQSFSAVGWEVVEASDGRDALVKAFVREPSLVITELHLPLINGFALCEVLRSDRLTATVPILVVTTETRPEQIKRARQAGADVVLAKPTDIEAIFHEARSLMIQSHNLNERWAAVRDKVVAQLEESANILAQSTQQRRSMLSKSYQRFATTTPPLSMPTLKCPLCGRPLNYEQSQVGGVSERHSEQWDEFTCSECGTFEYRHRTRKLRHVSEPFPL